MAKMGYRVNLLHIRSLDHSMASGLLCERFATSRSIGGIQIQIFVSSYIYIYNHRSLFRLSVVRISSKEETSDGERNGKRRDA